MNDAVDNLMPEELTLEDERTLLTETVFPPEEFELPEQTPEDLGKTEEDSA